LYVRDAYDHLMTNQHLVLTITYQGTNGLLYSENSRPMHPVGTVLENSSKSWSVGTFGGNAYVARRIRIVTANAVAVNTEVEAMLCVCMPAPTALQDVFINPELTMA